MRVADVQAFQDVGGVQPPGEAHILNFCEPFFKLDRMETQLHTLQTSNDVQERARICDLDHLDSSARVMLHEWTQ